MKLIFFLSLIFVIANSYAKEVDLLCRGTFDYSSLGRSYPKSRDLNFTFNDIQESISTDDDLFCEELRSVGLKSTGREFSKKRIYSSSETIRKGISDVGYCSHSFELNRHSGKLEIKKVENYEGILTIKGGIFNCELAKQKF